MSMLAKSEDTDEMLEILSIVLLLPVYPGALTNQRRNSKKQQTNGHAAFDDLINCLKFNGMIW